MMNLSCCFSCICNSASVTVIFFLGCSSARNCFVVIMKYIENNTEMDNYEQLC